MWGRGYGGRTEAGVRYSVRAAGLLLSAVAGTLAALPVYVMGLVVPMVLVWPLTLGAAALVAALVASLIGNVASRDGTRTRLLPVVGIAEGAAAILALASGLTYLVPDAMPAWPAIYSVVAVCAALALVATAASERWRGGGGTWRHDALIVGVLLLLSPLLVCGGVGAACATILDCGA